MKKILLLVIICPFVISSCGTLTHASRKVFLVEAPSDLTVSLNGKQVEVVQVISASGGSDHNVYYYPGLDQKFKKKNNIELTSGKQTAVVKMHTKAQVGLLLIELLIPPFGIATIIDLITSGHRKPDPRYIDVPAYLNHTKPRNQKELHKIILKSELK